MNPEVSVVIPTYNSEKYIAKALKSVFNQTYANFEIILIDDASTDLTVRIAKSFSDRRLRIIKNEQNRGVSYSRNFGINQARGKWIALLDSDDWYATERLEKLLDIASLKNADLVADDLYFCREDESQHWSTLLTEDRSRSRSRSPVVLIDAVRFAISDRLKPINANRTWSLGYVKPIIKREFLLENNICYDETINVGEDFTLYLECLRQDAKFYLLSQPYYYYRTRIASLSSRKPLEYLIQSSEITQKFIDREVRSTKESQLLQVLRQNLDIFQKRIEFYRLIQSLKNGNPPEAIKRMINSPHVIGDLYQRSMMILSERLVSLSVSEAKSDNCRKRAPKQSQVAYSERWYL